MDINEITEEIARLENGDTNWQNIERLSWLHTVYEHMTGHRDDVIHVGADSMPEYAGELGKAVSGKNIDSVMNILSEHMAVIKVLHPKEYQAVIEKINEIP